MHWWFSDFIHVSLLCIQLLLFGCGIRFVAAKISLDYFSYNDWPIYTALGCLGLSFIGAVFGCLQIQVLPLLVGIALVLQALGIWALISTRAFRISYQCLSIFIIAALLWTYQLRDHAVVVSNADGNVHLTFLLAILKSNHTLINNINVGLADLFGSSTFEFYPTGTHIAMSAFGYLPWKLELISAAQILKNWELLVLSGLGPLCWWIIRRLFPNQNAAFYFLLPLLFMLTRIYPMVPTDHSGLSRLIGYFLVFPLVVSMLLYSEMAWLLLLLLIGIPGAYFYHAGALGVFSFAWGIVFVYRVAIDRRHKELWKFKIPLTGVIFVIALALLLLLLRTSASLESIDSSNAPRFAKKFNFQHIFEVRYAKFLKSLWIDEYDYRPLLLSIRQWLLVLGIPAVLLFSKKLKISKIVVTYLVGIFVITSLLLLSFYSSNPNIFRLGLIYLHYEYRTAESLFLFLVLVWSSGFILVKAILENYIQSLKIRRTLELAFVVFFVFELRQSVLGSIERIERYEQRYAAPSRSDTHDLVAFIKSSTSDNTILIADGAWSYSLEGQTGREGIFQYGDCPTYKTENCNKRVAFYEPFHKEFLQVITQDNANQNCLNSVSEFHRPVVFILPFGDVSAEVRQIKSPCQNLHAVGQVGNYYVWKIENI